MRSVIQRVSSAKVTVDDKTVGSINKGLVALIGVENGDTQRDVDYMVDKISGLRVFEDNEGKMNLSVIDIEGSILAISQFTLLGDVRKGKRPSFSNAETPVLANQLYEKVIAGLKSRSISVEKGIFQADMLVEINNDGPVTILLDSRKNF